MDFLRLLLLPDFRAHEREFRLVVPVIEHVDGRSVVEGDPLAHRVDVLDHDKGMGQILRRQWHIYLVLVVVLLRPHGNRVVAQDASDLLFAVRPSDIYDNHVSFGHFLLSLQALQSVKVVVQNVYVD